MIHLKLGVYVFVILYAVTITQLHAAESASRTPQPFYNFLRVLLALKGITPTLHDTFISLPKTQDPLASSPSQRATLSKQCYVLRQEKPPKQFPQQIRFDRSQLRARNNSKGSRKK